MHRAIVGLGAFLLLAPALRSYSVLTHEAIIDSAWDTNITPLLLARFPNSTPDDLKQAHAYAYGGCIIQDMGYYPFGSKLFSDLVHYVRSGDFIVNLIRESQDLNEYAFALGALAHYAADTQGHSVAVNKTVPLEYPKLRREYGNVVTYEDDPKAHLRVEFSFDVEQVARGNYAPQRYHDFIGFKVAKPVLERAFQDTYSLDVKDIFGNLDLALGTYRRTVSVLIPEMTRVAWHLDKKQLLQANPKITRRKFIYNLSRASYRKEWDGHFRQPGAGARTLAFFIRVLPKVGPLKVLKFKPPTPEADKLFQVSFDNTMDEYRALLARQAAGQLQLPNRDFDTGELTRPGEYRMADEAYEKLAIKLAQRDPTTIDADVRQNVLAYFRDLKQPPDGERRPEEWQQAVAAVDKLKVETGVSEAERAKHD